MRRTVEDRRSRNCEAPGAFWPGLWVAALLGETTAELIGQALEQVPIKQVWAWCRLHLGTTLQSQRVAARRAAQSCSPAQQKPEEP